MRPPVLVAGWQCPAEAEGELATDWGVSRRWMFACHLPDGHDGFWHYDAIEDVSWMDGPPPGWELGGDGIMRKAET